MKRPTKKHRSPSKASVFDWAIDLFHTDIHGLIDQEKQRSRDVAQELLVKYEALPRDLWLYVLAKAFLATYTSDEREDLGTCNCCRFELLLILFSWDLHGGRVMEAGEAVKDSDEFKVVYDEINACCERLYSSSSSESDGPAPEWVGVLGCLINFLYEDDPRAQKEWAEAEAAKILQKGRS